MHQGRFRLGIRLRPRWGAYSTPSYPLAGFKGPTSKDREERGREGMGREGREEIREEWKGMGCAVLRIP